MMIPAFTQGIYAEESTASDIPQETGKEQSDPETTEQTQPKTPAENTGEGQTGETEQAGTTDRTAGDQSQGTENTGTDTPSDGETEQPISRSLLMKDKPELKVLIRIPRHRQVQRHQLENRTVRIPVVRLEKKPVMTLIRMIQKIKPEQKKQGQEPISPAESV